MYPTASFLSLCAHSFVWWLLTNALGATMIYIRFLTLTLGPAHGPVSYYVELSLASFIIPWFIATYLTLLWPIFALLPQWWALTARRPQVRRGRMLLVVLAPFALFAASQIIWGHGEGLVFTCGYLLAACSAAACMYRRWLWLG